MFKKTLLSLILVSGACGLMAQQIEYFVTEYNQASYQTDASSLVGMGTRTEWNWPSFGFYAAIDITDAADVISNAALSGPSFPGGLSIPWNGAGYDVFLDYDTEQDMAAVLQGGIHTFSGTGNAGLGNFSESVNLPAYSKLTDRLVTNFNELQAFDPNQPVTISWEPFTDGQGILADGTTPRGFIEVWIDYWDDTYGSQYAWSHLELSNLNEFDGLPATTTSVTVPAGTLTSSTNGYTVDIYFVRIEDFGDAQTVNGATVVQLHTMDTVLDIWPQQDPGNPWLDFPQLGDGWIDTGSWLGYLNVNEAHAPWVYSQNEQDYIYIPHNGVYLEGAWMWVPAPVAP